VTAGRKVRPDLPNIIEFVTDPQLLNLRLSPAQETLLRAIYGLPLVNEEQHDLWRQCTGRDAYRPGHPFGEVTVVAGARAGKDSRIAAPIACYEAVFGSHERRLHKGERGVVALVAPNQSMTDVALGYIRGYLEASPLLAPMIDNATAGKVHLSNRLDIVGFPCTKAALRSWSIPVGVLDELGFYRLEGSVESDAEIQASIRRGMVGFDVGSKLVKISTPYIKGGVLYEDVKRAFGRNDPDLLVWRAPSRLMNPMLATERLDRERRLDPLRFAREYEAEFAEDVAAFLPSAWVDAAVVAGRYELPPPAVAVFFAVDSSGGGSAVFTLAGLHCEDRAGRVYYVHDVLKGWTRTRERTINLEATVDEAAEIVRRYGADAVLGDQYSAGWVRQAFERRGILYIVAPEKSVAYASLEPVLAQGALDLLDHPALIRELKLLERRPRPGGRDRIDHPRAGHDDHANALALAVHFALATIDAAETAPSTEPSDLERAQLHAMGWRLPDETSNVVFDEDRGMFMDDPRYDW